MYFFAIGLLDDGKNLNFVMENNEYRIPIDELEIPMEVKYSDRH